MQIKADCIDLQKLYMTEYSTTTRYLTFKVLILQKAETCLKKMLPGWQLTLQYYNYACFNAVGNAALTEGSKVVDIQCWFSALPLTYRDFGGIFLMFLMILLKVKSLNSLQMCVEKHYC